MIVCGWYTENYATYKDKLVSTIPDGLGYDFREVKMAVSDWAVFTRAKPEMALMFRELYPANPLMLIDVDAEFVGSASDVKGIMTIFADVGVRVSSRPDNGSLFWPNSALLILRPTLICEDMLRRWNDLCAAATDQSTPDEYYLAQALAETPNITIRSLPARARPLDSDGIVNDPIIRFKSASTELGLKP